MAKKIVVEKGEVKKVAVEKEEVKKVGVETGRIKEGRSPALWNSYLRTRLMSSSCESSTLWIFLVCFCIALEILQFYVKYHLWASIYRGFSKLLKSFMTSMNSKEHPFDEASKRPRHVERL